MSAPPPPPRKPRPESRPSGDAGQGPPPPPPRRATPSTTAATPTGTPVESTAVGRASRPAQPAPATAPVAASPSPAKPKGGSPSTGRGRTALLAVLGIVGVLVVAAVAFLVLRSDSAEDTGPELRASTSVDLQPGELTVEAVAFPGEFPTDVRDLVLSTLGAYVDHGMVNPLRTGAADEAMLATVFDAGALARLAGTDRPLVLDEGLPKAAGKISVRTPPVAMTALTEAGGKAVLVSATVALSVEAQTNKGRLEILRSGTLVFAPDDTGAWKITGWTLSTERGGRALGPTTTTTTPTTAAPAP